MIIWLASYPKSGNTWVRLFLDFYINNHSNINNLKINQFPQKIYTKDLIKDFSSVKEFSVNCNLAQTIINMDNKIKFFKTHNSYWSVQNHKFTDETNTLGVIHIVRDPRNVITSLQNHYDIKDSEKALSFITNKNKFISNSKNENEIMHVISSWSNHYRSWKKFKKNYLLVKYEDLLTEPKKEFERILRYLNKIANIKFDTSKFNYTLNNTKFDNLKKKENQNGFKELLNNDSLIKKNFFHLGPNNNWRQRLELNIINKIEDEFKDEMIELKYLN
jgi:hypothetical protein